MRMLLEDADAPRSLGLHPLRPDGEALVLQVDAADGDRRWTLTGNLLTRDEATGLGAWLADLPGDLTLGADEWTALTFRSPALSLAGRRMPGGGVELRVSVLGMSDPDDSSPPPGQPRRTTDVVLGLRLPTAAVEEAAVTFVEELSALPE